MSRLIETLKIKEGEVYNIDFHNRRMNSARRKLFGCKDEIDLSGELRAAPSQGLIKCRVLYDSTIHEIQFIPYVLPVIHSLQVVRNGQIEYPFKYENRKALEALFEQKKQSDDMLIIKNGQATDTYFCNVVFEKSDGLLYTPANCLLKGTKRQQLLELGKIKERPIKETDIPGYERVYLINALIDLEDRISVEMDKVSF